MAILVLAEHSNSALNDATAKTVSAAAAFGVERPHNPLIADAILQNYSWKRLARESLARGELPLWNPFARLGEPFVASGAPAPPPRSGRTGTGTCRGRPCTRPPAGCGPPSTARGWARLRRTPSMTRVRTRRGCRQPAGSGFAAEVAESAEEFSELGIEEPELLGLSAFSATSAVKWSG